MPTKDPYKYISFGIFFQIASSFISLLNTIAYSLATVVVIQS